MAIITLNPMIRSIHGKMGNIVFVHRKGTQFVRRHVVPFDPKTKSQIRNRIIFAETIRLWKKLPQSSKNSWNKYAKTMGRTGYNVFISENIKAFRQGTGPKLLKVKNSAENENAIERELHTCRLLFNTVPFFINYKYFPYKRNAFYLHRE